ncbi:MAG: glycosyltransferase family 4 protein [Candidatus Acidiferrales bacterium]
MILGLFPGLASVGGVQLAGRQTAAASSAIAAERGWACVFLSLNDARGEHEATVAELPFRFMGFGRQKQRFLFNALSLAREKPKLVFAAHPNLAPIAGAMKAMCRDTRTIVGAHGVEIWQPLPAIRRRMLRRADLVTAPSSDTARRLARIQGVPEEKIRKLPWPLDPEFAAFAECADKLPRPEGFPRGQVVLSVGRWAADERYKGADLLIQAIAELAHDFSELHLVLAGSGDDLPRLKQQARNSGASGRVHFVTDLSRKELAACYAGADIFALPSTGEGFGLVFLEAMAFGKPVIGVNVGGIPDVVESGREGLLIEPTTAAISVALRRLLSDPRLREELGARGRQRANGEFTFQNFQRRLLAILNEIA